MAASKVKNFLILALLLVNIFLLALVIPARLRAAQKQTELGLQLEQLFEGEGLTLDPSILPDELTLYELELSDNAAAEQTAAQALLGEQTQISDDESRFQRTYTSDAGECSFSAGDGSFTATLSTPLSISASIAKSAVKILEKIGYSACDLSDPARVSAGVYRVTALQKLLDAPVFSSRVTLTFENGALTDIDAIWFPGQPVRVSEDACISAADALTAFLASRDTLGWVGDRVDAVRQGYVRVETPSASVIRLKPVWRLTTDTGEFEVDGLTRAVTAVS